MNNLNKHNIKSKNFNKLNNNNNNNNPQLIARPANSANTILSKLNKNLIKNFSLLFSFLLIILFVLVLLDVKIDYDFVAKFFVSFVVSASLSGYMAKSFYILLRHSDELKDLELQMNTSKLRAFLQLILVLFLIVFIIQIIEYIDLLSYLKKLFVQHINCSSDNINPSSTPSSSSSGSSRGFAAIVGGVGAAAFTAVFSALPKTLPIIPRAAASAILAGASASGGEAVHQKQILNRIIYGIKTGWSMPLLPDHISKFDQNIYVKIFKFFGALSSFFIISGIGYKFNSVIFYIAIIISLLYIIYRLVLTCYVLIQFIRDVKNGKLIVKNSPLDYLSTIFRTSTRITTTTARITLGTGFTYALCHELDDILEQEGKERYFVPMFKRQITQLGLDTHISRILTKFGITDINTTEPVILQPLDTIIKTTEERQELEKTTGIPYDQAKVLYEYIHVRKLSEESGVMVKEIEELVKKSNPFGVNNK